MAPSSSPFNWEDTVGPALINSNGEEVSTSIALNGKKYVMLYLSAHWCPPCRRFTPLLAAAYDAHKNFITEGRNVTDADDSVGEIEVIFISFDSVNSEFDNYRNTMPWLSVPFANLHSLNIKETLSKQYSIGGIPTLIVIDGKNGKLVSMDGRGLYRLYFKGEYPSSSLWSSSWGCAVM